MDAIDPKLRAASRPSAAWFPPDKRSAGRSPVSVRPFRAVTLLATLATGWLPAQTVILAPQVVTAARAPQPPALVPFALQIVDHADLQAAPTATLDGALRAVPGFSLFRRSDSLTTHPTSQGVSLRGLGPSGASRSLVLLDGVPLNDPFGGWVAWTKVPREGLASVEILRGGGATAWGNAALAGVVQLLTQPVAGDASHLMAAFGDFDTRSVEADYTHTVGRATVQFLGRSFATRGYDTVAPERRGPIDTSAGNRHRWLTARWRESISPDTGVILTARAFAEKRANGTPGQHNATRETFGSVALSHQANATFAWTATAYAQDQSFSSTFSAVNPTRTAETPASDQFAVPAVALGAAWTGVWAGGDGASTSAGADVRRVRGETRENFAFSNGDFTRRRLAGGAQWFTGLFALHECPLGAHWRALLGARLDSWQDTDGHRREADRATGVLSRDDNYPGRHGIEFSPSGGLVWQPGDGWRLRAAAQHAFRRPTLNELYRPFRVGNVITEANAGLRTEHATSAELGLTWSRWHTADSLEKSLPHPATSPPAGLVGVSLGVTPFWTELHDAVGNVTVAHGPGDVPGFGFIPAGGTGQQRLNLDRIRVRGLELSARWQPAAWLGFTADYLADDATVRRASVAPALAGKRLAQVARNSAAFGLRWRLGSRGPTLTPRLRWIGRQFEDDQNQLVLGEAAVVDLGVTVPFGLGGELFLTVENLGNARLETGRSADGIVNLGTPRFILVGLRFDW